MISGLEKTNKEEVLDEEDEILRNPSWDEIDVFISAHTCETGDTFSDKQRRSGTLFHAGSILLLRTVWENT